MPRFNSSAADKANLIYATLKDDLKKIAQANHHDPFKVLGNQTAHHDSYILFYAPDTDQLNISKESIPTLRLANSDFFACLEQLDKIEEHYLITRTNSQNDVNAYHDPYSFKPQIKEDDLNLFSAGKHLHIYKILGAHAKTIDGVAGILFATWAPNASRVSVIGDFNNWDGRRYPMRSRGASGVWELFEMVILGKSIPRPTLTHSNWNCVHKLALSYTTQLHSNGKIYNG